MARALPTPLRAMLPLALSFAVVLGVNFLPSDTALEDINAAGRITVCAPRDMGLLATRDAARPGFEIELIEEVARRSGWRVAVTRNVAMGREFNPGNWRISRATCRILVGGMRDNAWSKSLLELGEPYLSSSWVWVAPPGAAWPPQETVFSPGVFALDRAPLGTYLRENGIKVAPVKTPDELVEALHAGQLANAITDSTTATFLAQNHDLTVSPLPEGPAPTDLSFGVWKGDTSLRLHIDYVIDQMRNDDFIEGLRDKYGM